ncbi:hypothetical protein CEUSTIGMA_g25.t1 [Chlamydomonas eustigma]|uniref:Uncharacterized protein n=1 Tax=Chlamydomonas eustigma TaxID=1157962 RepID=A0A250WPF3_9CHLO|nr:hypothetical protein CEUSTIGMA_g25.t1 [Chlamydomonas eustigma]|eukprot:GAX72569.1 hypothetical protein CEUSTIGMA_g25.t1 [Chlamydomonas eustigma]
MFPSHLCSLHTAEPTSTDQLGATITGDKDYQIGDLTKRVLFGSQRSCTSLSVVKQVKEPVKKNSYRLGDLTRKYIEKDYQCGDLTKRFVFGAEAVNKAKQEKKYLLEQQNDEPNEPYDDKTVEGAFYCKKGWGSQLVWEMLPDLYIRLGVPIQEHYRLLSLPRPASTAVLAIEDRKEAAEDSWDTTLANLAQDCAIYAELLDPQLSEPGLLLAAISHHHSLMQQDAPSTLSLLEALHAQSQSQMPADASSIKCSSEIRQMHPCVWVAVQNLLHGITSPPVQKKALLASTVPPSAPCWYFYDARARVAFHYVAAMLQMPFSTVLDMENKHAADLARQSLQYTNAGEAVPVVGSAANTANSVAGSSGAGAVTTAGFNYCGASRVAGSAARGMVGGGVQQYGFLELSGNHPMQQPVQVVQGYQDTTPDGT